MILFPGESNAEYGVLLADDELAETGDPYVAFVVRKDGSAAVLSIHGHETVVVVPWARHEAVLPHDGTGVVQNVLRVELEPGEIAFYVNGEQLATLPRETAPAAGRFGFRIGPDVNIHVTNLDLTRRRAPAGGR